MRKVVVVGCPGVQGNVVRKEACQSPVALESFWTFIIEERGDITGLWHEHISVLK